MIKNEQKTLCKIFSECHVFTVFQQLMKEEEKNIWGVISFFSFLFKQVSAQIIPTHAHAVKKIWLSAKRCARKEDIGTTDVSE